MISRRHARTNNLGRFEISNPYKYDLRARAAILHMYIEQGATFYRQFNWKRSLLFYESENRPFTGVTLNGSAYKWTQSTNALVYDADETEEENCFYLEAAAGGDPSLTKADVFPCVIGGEIGEEVTGAFRVLTDGECWWGDAEVSPLGFDTIYVNVRRVNDNDNTYAVDPDDKYEGFILGTVIKYGVRLTIKEEFADAVPLLEYTIGSGLSFINSIVPGGDGMFDLSITATVTAALSFTSGFYTLEVYHLTDPEVYRLVEGKVLLSKEVANS